MIADHNLFSLSSHQLYSRTSPPQTLARITLASGVITVQLSYEAMQKQLFEAVLIATIVLQSGRNID
jgi:hypothetical protein